MAHTRSPVAVTGPQVAAFRLRKHHLLERAAKSSMVRVAGEMGGAQAQLLSAAVLAIGTRVSDSTAEAVERAIAARKLVKASCMRSTLFLVPAAELPKFAFGAAARAQREIGWARGKGVPDKAIQRATEAALDALDQPRTRPEIAEKVSRALGVKHQAVHGGGWGRRSKIAAVPVGHLTYPVVDLLHLAAARGVICYGPNRGTEPTFVRAEAWLPRWKDLPNEEAEDALLRRYLKAFGPSTSTDFSFWCGLTLADGRRIWSRALSDLAQVDVDGTPAFILRGDVDVLAASRMPRNHVRLLPHFDSFLLGHRERDHILASKYRLQVFRPQGWVAPVLLVEGRVAGVWQQVRDGGQLHVRVKRFQALPHALLSRIRSEAKQIARFLKFSDVVVHIT